MESHPKLSVIVPIYKVEPYLRQCLDSVVNQTYRNLEIILVDDGSPDNCGAICDEYAVKDDRIMVIHKENGGLSAARNDGMERATGEWLTFVDSDDWCELDYYEKLLTEAGDQDVDVFCAGGHFREFDKKTVILSTFAKRGLYCHKEETDGLMMKCMTGNYQGLTDLNNGTMCAPWDKLYRTEFLKRHQLKYDTACKAWEDIWFNFLVFDKAQRVGGCPYIGYHYRMVSTSITKGFNPKKPQINLDFASRLYSYMEQREPNEMIQQAIAARCLSLLSNAFQVDYFHPTNTKPYKEIVREIRDMKTWPYYHEAIYSDDDRYLSRNQIIFKRLLRLPWVWPAKLAYRLKCAMEK